MFRTNYSFIIRSIAWYTVSRSFVQSFFTIFFLTCTIHVTCVFLSYLLILFLNLSPESYFLFYTFYLSYFAFLCFFLNFIYKPFPFIPVFISPYLYFLPAFLVSFPISSFSSSLLYSIRITFCDSSPLS